MSKSVACPFCAIIAGDADASVVYSDGRVIAFMTLRPTRPGECLVVPKQHIDHFTDIPNDLAAHIMIIAQEIGRRMMVELSPQRIGMIVHGFGVAHAHLIIVPQDDPTDIVSARHGFIQNNSIQYSETQVPMMTRAELDAMADRLKLPTNA